MSLARFQFYNVTGAVFWVVVLVMAGYFFGNIPVIRDHLNTIVLIGVAAAVVPVALGAVWRFVAKFRKGGASGAASVSDKDAGSRLPPG
jgi:membrane-associated protein